ncbi:MAG: transposase [Candidatus Binataceae bacterium]|nr:transposase [Candidatus Binataceae bacterium]
MGPLSDKHRQLVWVLNLIRIEAMVGSWSGGVGRPAKDRRAMARSFVAKAVFNLSTTRQLLDRLSVDISLRRICGWESRREIPHEAQFSRAFADFAASELPQRLHAALIAETQQARLIGHISRDSTEIEAREKPLRKPVAEVPLKPVGKRGRPKSGEPSLPPEPTRLERQAGMTLEQMLDDLPRAANVGSKNNSKGCKETWVGYKLHLDVADGQIPISCILTSASLHDSQAAIPLARMTAQRVTHLYDLMDSAYDAQSIHEQVRGLGQIPIIDAHPRRDAAQKAELQAEAKRRKLLNFNYAEDLRYRERTTVERVNARLKDEFGGRTIRVRGNAKAMCHLMFGIVALAADQILRLIT